MDIAVLQIDGNIPAATLNYDTPKTGSTVYTLGSSKGLTDTFTNGMVSNNSRVVEDYKPDMTYIQITAPITNGNSGGPTINEYAEVIGINTWFLSNGQNLNFAIPVKYLNDLDYSNPVDVGTTSSVGDNNDVENTDILSVDLDAVFLKKGGTAVIYVELAGFDPSNLVVNYNDYYVACQWAENNYYNTSTGNSISVLFVTGLADINSIDLKVFVNGYEDFYSENITVNISPNGWYDYGGFPNAVDLGAYSGVTPISYYISEDADYCGFTYDINQLFDAGLTSENMVKDFFDVLNYYGYTQTDSQSEGNDHSYIFYNSEYNRSYSIAYYIDNGYISVVFNTR